MIRIRASAAEPMPEGGSESLLAGRVGRLGHASGADGRRGPDPGADGRRGPDPGAEGRHGIASGVGRGSGLGEELAPGAFRVSADACTLDGAALAEHDWGGVVASGRLRDVRGAFAIAHRGEDGTLTLARDALGERALYYAEGEGGGLAFAARPAMLRPPAGGAPTLHVPALLRYLAYAYVPGPETMIAGVRELLPGEVLRRSPGGSITSSRLWEPPPEPPRDHPHDEEALRLGLRAALETAVRRRLPAPDLPAGAFLSGGLDSSLVVALMARLRSSSPLHTYSIHFGAGHADELAFSSLVARRCGTRHRIVELPAEAVGRHLDATVAMLGEPIGDPLTVPNALLFREAAREVTVVLNGEGGDPCFGGPKNLPMLLAALQGDGGSRDARHPRARSYLRSHQKCYDELGEMLAPDLLPLLAEEFLERELAGPLSDPRQSSLVQRLMALNVAFKGGHHILPKVEAVSAPFGVRARSPLFDRDVAEAAFRLPPRLKLHGAVEKWLLKRAVADLLPAAVLDRPKSGMMVPVEAWFALKGAGGEGPLLAMARERLLEGLAPRGLLRRAWLEDLLAGRTGGLRPRRGVKIWLLLTLEAWLARRP